ncbi:MAG: redoxin domain-containing protein [Bacteroidota bacterium]
MNKFICLLVSSLLCLQWVHADQGYRIEVKIDGLNQTEAYLGYHYGEKQYIQDTVQVNENGSFVFEGDEALKAGVYLFVMPPDNNFFQLLVTDEEQQYKVHTTMANMVGDVKIDNGPDNALFYEYMKMLGSLRPRGDKLNKDIEAATDEAQKEKLRKELAGLGDEVTAYQQKLIAEHPKSLTAAIVRSALEVDIPEFEGEMADYDRWQWVKAHWFDNISMGDDRLLRSPVLFGKIDHYVNKLTTQHPDSINQAIDRILGMLEPAEESFKYYLIHFLNSYAKSKIVGFDAVYVHIVDKYYAKGLAPWTEDEQLKKIVENSDKLKPLLIGKTAPDITVYKESGESISLHSLEVPFTVLFFWDPDCGHCKKSMPDMLKFHDKYKAKGVEVFAVCTKVGKDNGKCWETVEEKEMGRWINVTDQWLRSKYKTIYDIRTTPQIYILDESKTILSKRIAATQLEEVMDQLIKIRSEEKDVSGSGK